MDLSRVPLADGDQNFLDEARDFLTTQVADEVRRRVTGIPATTGMRRRGRWGFSGTLAVFRKMIAQYMLGSGKPNYSAPEKV